MGNRKKTYACLALAVGVLFALAACGAQLGFKDQMNSWVGKLTYDQAVKMFGPPRSIQPTADGKVVVFKKPLDVYIQMVTITFNKSNVMTSWKEKLLCCIYKKG